MQKSSEDTQMRAALDENNNPIFQEIARFRSILFDAMLKPHDMTMSQSWLLVHVVRENGLRQSDLAEKMEIAAVTTSKLIDRLEARGFLERRAAPDDRRSKLIYPTAKARSLVKIMTETVFEVEDIANAGIDRDELEVALRVLRQMRDNLREATKAR